MWDQARRRVGSTPSGRSGCRLRVSDRSRGRAALAALRLRCLLCLIGQRHTHDAVAEVLSVERLRLLDRDAVQSEQTLAVDQAAGAAALSPQPVATLGGFVSGTNADRPRLGLNPTCTASTFSPSIATAAWVSTS